MKYVEPVIEIIQILQGDIITGSPGLIVPDPDPPTNPDEPDWSIPF